MSLLTDRYLPAVCSITENGTDYLYWVYSVEKLRITMIRKFKGIFRMPGARITDQLCASEAHQAGFSSDFYYPLVPRVQDDA